jgi:membrane fusion protein (multidrug efflux system)
MTRRRALMIFIGCFVFLGTTALYVNVDWTSVTTENAYVSGDPVIVTTQTAGLVKSVMVTDTQEVKAGQILVVLDDFDLQRAEREAQFNLESAMVRMQQASSSVQVTRLQETGSASAKTVADLEYQSAIEERRRSQQDLDRIHALHNGRWVSEKALLDSESALRLSELRVEQKRQQVRQASNNIETSRIGSALQEDDVRRLQAEVNVARAQLDVATANVRRSQILAQVPGIIATRQVNPGQRVDAGATLMQIVPTSQLYVNANFKEDQLAHVRVGDAALLTSDLYGSSVVFHGRVVGFSGGTGAAFSAIPTVNASGNWIKVAQRLPVRIALDPIELKNRPLRLGLSMTVSIQKR